MKYYIQDNIKILRKLKVFYSIYYILYIFLYTIGLPNLLIQNFSQISSKLIMYICIYIYYIQICNIYMYIYIYIYIYILYIYVMLIFYLLYLSEN